MARTAAHRLNNTLALVVGYTDLLAQHPAVRARPHLATFAQAALESSMRAAGELSRMQRLVRLVEDSSLVLPFPVLDLDRSTVANWPPDTSQTATTAPPPGQQADDS